MRKIGGGSGTECVYLGVREMEEVGLHEVR